MNTNVNSARLLGIHGKQLRFISKELLRLPKLDIIGNQEKVWASRANASLVNLQNGKKK